MRVQTKLYAIYTILLLSTAVVGTVALGSMHRWRSAVEALSITHAQSLRAVELRGHLLRQFKEVLDAFVIDDPDADVEMLRSRKESDSLLAQLSRQARTSEERALIDRLRQIDQEVFWVSLQVFEDLRHGAWDRARTRMEQDLERRLFPQEEQAIARLRYFYQEDAGRAIERAIVRNRWVQITTGFTLLFVLLQGLTLSWGIHRWLVRPLQVIRQSTAVLSTGDLSHRVPIYTRDEFGELAASIHRMAAALQESQDRLIRSERLAAVGELTSYIAHNVRNPLASIRSAAQVGLDDLADGDLLRVRETLEDVIHVVDRLEAWVQNLLDLTRPLVLQRNVQDVTSVLQDVVAILRPKGSTKGLELVTEFPSEPLRTSIDAGLMEQALVAVVANAIEASPPGARVQIRAHLDRETGWVVITVQDEGAGIPAHLLEKVFVPYFTTKADGMGLGLTMAKKIIEAHGGVIKIASQEGQGTTVTIRLPMGGGACPES
jgi:signal transduction histidine kinase